ncbi:MAG: hypothetical protein IPM15_11965 [Betaproteobacteria bacterium]|nr:hypothetical protein [Betaproteobacteria bacterium]
MRWPACSPPALTESLAANVVVENVPGAGGTIGVDRMAKAVPDGYTLVLSGDAALVLTGGAYGVKAPYETLRDLAPIAQLIITPNVLVVSNDVPARSVAELVALVRSPPGRFSFASGGIGFSTHRAGESMNSMAGLDMVHVPNPGPLARRDRRACRARPSRCRAPRRSSITSP